MHMDYNELEERIALVDEQVRLSTGEAKFYTARLRERYSDNLRTFGVRYGEDFVAIPLGKLGNWQRFAGFEYIDDEEITRLGNWTIYPEHEESGRVAEALQILRQPKKEASRR